MENVVKSNKPFYKKWRVWLIVAIVIVGVIGVAGCNTDGEKDSDSASSVDKPSITVTAADIYKEYHENKDTADGKYKGKTFEITGTVHSIDTDINDVPFVSLSVDEDGVQVPEIRCLFSGSGSDSLSKLKKGDQVTIDGVGDGYDTLIFMKDCKLISK